MKKDAKNKNVQKENNKYDEVDINMLEKNAKAKNILICGHGPDEYIGSQAAPSQNKFETLLLTRMRRTCRSSIITNVLTKG